MAGSKTHNFLLAGRVGLKMIVKTGTKFDEGTGQKFAQRIGSGMVLKTALETAVMVNSKVA